MYRITLNNRSNYLASRVQMLARAEEPSGRPGSRWPCTAGGAPPHRRGRTLRSRVVLVLVSVLLVFKLWLMCYDVIIIVISIVVDIIIIVIMIIISSSSSSSRSSSSSIIITGLATQRMCSPSRHNGRAKASARPDVCKRRVGGYC